MFKDRKLAIATKHQKEQVIAPLLQEALAVRCFVPEHLDTDTLGTFTGEIERKDSPLAILRNKCMMAMELTGCNLAVANEGSFGPHPTIFFSPADEEVTMLMDKQHNLEISCAMISTNTNFAGEKVSNERELIAFAKKALFPSHGLIIRDKKNGNEYIAKGITDWGVLLNQFAFFKKNFGSVFVETDMRAMYNPTRMSVIKEATEKLINKINSLCPLCNTPGFGVTDAKPGLPCSLCGAATRSTLNHIYTCSHCSFTKEIFYPHNITSEDPMYCDFCNP